MGAIGDVVNGAIGDVVTVHGRNRSKCVEATPVFENLTMTVSARSNQIDPRASSMHSLMVMPRVPCRIGCQGK